MTENQETVLKLVKHFAPVSELELNKYSNLLYNDIHTALRDLKRSGVIDTDDDGQYFVKE